MKLLDIPLDKIVVTKNVRLDQEDQLSDLMSSIEQHDILQPVLVIPRDGKYELIAGHRRLAAMRARNEATIPAIVRDDISNRDIPYLKLIENVQRKELSAKELVAAFEELKREHPGLTTEGLARMLGKSTPWVVEQYRLCAARDELLAAGMTPAEIKAFTRSELVSLGRIKDKAERAAVAQELSKGEKRSSRVTTKQPRGEIVDRSGGIAIMGAPSSLILRVSCEDQGARRDVIACLLRLKVRRVGREANP